MKNLMLIIVLIFGSVYGTQGLSKEQKSSNKAMIDLSPNKPVQKLFPLTILSINGESVTHRNHMIMLEPGKYHLKFLSNIDLNYFVGNNRILKSKINQRKWDDSLDLVVESGNTYHLGFDASSVKTDEWKPVLLSTTEHNK